MSSTNKALTAGLKTLSLQASVDMLTRFQTLLSMLGTWTSAYNLTAITEPE